MGDDAVVKPLIDLAAFKVMGASKQRVATEGDEVMLWAILVMGSLDPPRLTDKARNQVAVQLDTLASFAPSVDCKTAAKAAKAKFPLKR